MAYLWGILACAAVGAIAWFYGQYRARLDMENRAISLLSKIAELVAKEDLPKAQKIIKRFTSGEMRIRDILIFENLD